MRCDATMCALTDSLTAKEREREMALFVVVFSFTRRKRNVDYPPHRHRIPVKFFADFASCASIHNEFCHYLQPGFSSSDMRPV